MYANYTYAAGASLSNVQADIGAILTGETNKANLSAACVQGSTEIISTLVAGWTLHDAAAGTNAVCYKAPLADDPTKFKYMVLSCTTTAILTKAYETWNALTHTGTNLCYNSDQTTTNQRLDLTTGSSLLIFASARFCVLLSNTGLGYGSVSYGGPSGILERTRDLPFDTVAEGGPPWGFVIFGYATVGTVFSCSSPRVMNNAGSYVSTSQARFYLQSDVQTTWWVTALSGTNQLIPSGASTFYVPFFPGFFVNYTTLMSAPYGNFSSLCDVWTIPSGVCTHLQTIQKGGVDYLVVRRGSDTVEMMVLRKS